VLTIVVLLILLGITLRTGSQVVENARENRLTTELDMVQHSAMERYTKVSLTNEQYPGVSYPTKQDALNDVPLISSEITLLGEDGDYYRLSKDDLTSLGVEKSEYEYIINYKTGEVINATKQVTPKGVMLYIFAKQSVEMGDNVGYTPPAPPAPIIPEQQEPSAGNQSGGSLGTRQTGVVEIAWLDLDNNVIQNPLAPKLKGGMTPIKWNGTQESNAATSGGSWYSYTAQTGANDGRTSRWANVRITDGSYFVWIPRYAYKIIYFDTEAHANDYRTNGLTQTNQAWIEGYSTVYGMIDKNGKVVNNTKPNLSYKVKTANYRDYIPHPAFLGVGYENLGGGFGADNKGVSGFWMAKYEMSGETNGSPSAPGNVLTSSTIKMVSKPNVVSWRSITIGNMFTNSKNYGTNVGQSSYNSHMMKNSEWRGSGLLNS